MSLKDPLDRQIADTDWKSAGRHLTDQQRQRWQRAAMGLRLSKSMMLREYAVNLERLPQEFDVTPPVALERLFRALAVFFLVMTGIPFVIIVGLNEPETPWWAYPAMAIMPIVCITTIVVCTKRIWRQRHLRFETDGVRVRQHGPGGAREWHVPYAEFRGLAQIRKTINTRYAERDFHIVMLVHQDPEKSVAMAVDTGVGYANAFMHGYSRRLRLPILDEAASAS